MTIIHSFFKAIIRIFLLFIIIPILKINIDWHYAPNCEKGINTDVLHQLKHLKEELHHKKAATEMQQLFPEGFIFTNVLYGLAWAECLKHADKHSPIFQEGCKEIRWAISELASNQGKDIFNSQLPLSYGAFYRGWSAYLQGQYLSLNAQDTADFNIYNSFKNNCLEIKSAIEKTELPYLESYAEAAWPADNILCLASLKLHDNLYPPQYSALISHWLERIKSHLDPQTQLIPHAYSLSENKGVDGARGSSQSLILCFLPKIDTAFAYDQFQKYKKAFVIHRLGLPAIAEYPSNTEGEGDIDSGPVIWGVGASASIVGIKTMAENHDGVLHKSIRNSIEGLGLPLDFKENKYYLFNQLPVSDAFIAWCSTSNCQAPDNEAPVSAWLFHLISAIIIGLGLWLMVKI